MSHARKGLAVLALIAGGLTPFLPAAQLRVRPIDLEDGAVALALMLRQLDNTGVFMQATAHPDDENNALHVYLNRGQGARTILATATRGVLRVRLTARGRAAHSSRPDLGVSAIDKLIDALVRLRGEELPDDATLGRTHYTVGVISGGVAPNVVSAHAEAEVMFRTVGPASDLDAVLAPLGDLVEITQVLEVPAVHLKIVDGFETASFSFTTDIPFLGNWGEPLLFGPGSILVAHTDDEHVGIEVLEAAAEGYQRLAQQLLR